MPSGQIGRNRLASRGHTLLRLDDVRAQSQASGGFAADKVPNVRRL